MRGSPGIIVSALENLDQTPPSALRDGIGQLRIFVKIYLVLESEMRNGGGFLESGPRDKCFPWGGIPLLVK
jgi:hypothetical protein